VTLAVLRTGRPGAIRVHQEESSPSPSAGHPMMRVSVTLAATSDGTLTALAVDEF
jgi:hypothetical protein